jgi:predicted phage terminase large subunit-like protein
MIPKVTEMVKEWLAQQGVFEENTDKRVLEEIRQLLRQRARSDLWFLCYSVLDFPDVNTKLHREMCFRWQKREHRRYTLWMLPRLHLKTTIWVIGDTIRVALNDPNRRQLLVSATLGNVIDMLKEITAHFETNEVLRWLFPEYCYDKANTKTRRRCSWTTERVDWPCRTVWRKEGNIEVMAVRASMVSKHFDDIRFDDAVNDLNTSSRDSCLAVHSWFLDAWQLRDSPRSRIRLTGTPWSYGDFYQIEQEKERKRRELGKKPFLLVYKKPCWDANGDPIWPERFSKQDLEDIAFQVGSYKFACNYLLNPMPEGAAYFNKDSVKIVHPTEIPKGLVHFIAIDLAEEDSPTPDQTVIMVAGVDEFGRIFIRHIDREKMYPLSIMERIAYLSKKYEVEKVAVETTAFQKTIYKEFLRWSAEKRVFVPWTEVKRGKQHKNMRIRALQPLAERGHLFVVSGLEHYEALIEELVTFDKGRTDDLLDALATIQEIYYDAPETILSRREPSSLNGMYGDLAKLSVQDENYYENAVNNAFEELY